MYGVPSATIACCIHRGRGGDQYISIDIYYPSPTVANGNTLMNYPKIDKGKLCNGLHSNKKANERTN